MASKRDRVPPLLRAFDLLERIARTRGSTALADLSAASGLPKPTAYRLLAMLEEAGLVTREPGDRRIAAGPRLVRFALDVQMSEAVRAPRHAILKRLADHLGETVNLTMLDGSEVVYIDRVETQWPLRMTLQPGSHVPLHCTASGKLLLALLPAARRRRIVDELPLQRFTEQTITNRRALEAELAAIRRDNLSTDNEEYLVGLVCVAVPVAAHDGRNVACVAVHAPVARMTLDRALTHVPALRNAAEALGATFGSGQVRALG
ncbi:MAG: IclR family transcriptional regulator [Burkholderiales bacterium]|nr:IclR family transcriptional regulator [Burkholderiales bacterium]